MKATKKQTPLTRAQKRIKAAKAAQPKTKSQWAKVIRTAESVLRSAGVKI